MSENFLIVPVLLPLLGALGVRFIKLGNKRARQAAVVLTTFCEAAAIWAAILFCGGRYEIFEISYGAHIVLAFDGLGKFFAGIIGLLWPLTAIYSFGYMDDNVYSTRFYEFFLLSLGITIGIAEAGNMITMYCFYEFLTLATLPLIMYYMTKTSVRAGLKYLVFAIGGAAFAFVGMAYLMAEGFSLDFVLGGTVSTTEKVNTYLAIYLMMFFGFGVKAGICSLRYSGHFSPPEE